MCHCGVGLGLSMVKLFAGDDIAVCCNVEISPYGICIEKDKNVCCYMKATFCDGAEILLKDDEDETQTV